MGISPLASLFVFCRSPDERRAREAGIRAAFGKFGESEGRENILNDSLLTVSDESCVGDVKVFGRSPGHPSEHEWALCEAACRSVFNDGLCDSYHFGRGCRGRIPLIGKSYSSGIIGCEDAARLTVLYLFRRLNHQGLSVTIDDLDLRGAAKTYCRGRQWRTLLKESMADDRFGRVVIGESD